MEEKKVKITAFYISTFATQQTREWTFETILQAKEFIEGNMDEISKPQYKLEAISFEGNDVTRFTSFSFSHLDVTDNNN
jgi:hypothetical protein